jgi:DNA-binding response OmpR family regulator
MGLLKLDKSQYKAYKGQQLLNIDRNEFNILWVLSSRPDRVFSIEDIALELEKEYYDFKAFSIIQCLKSLQEKLNYQNIRLMTTKGFKLDFKKD